MTVQGLLVATVVAAAVGMVRLSALCEAQTTVYPIVTSDTCADKGYGWIADAVACEVAAGQVDWSDTTAETNHSLNYPQGCYNESSSQGSELRFNTQTASSRSCDYAPAGQFHTSKACLCAAFTGLRPLVERFFRPMEKAGDSSRRREKGRIADGNNNVSTKVAMPYTSRTVFEKHIASNLTEHCFDEMFFHPTPSLG